MFSTQTQTAPAATPPVLHRKPISELRPSEAFRQMNLVPRMLYAAVSNTAKCMAFGHNSIREPTQVALEALRPLHGCETPHRWVHRAAFFGGTPSCARGGFYPATTTTNDMDNG